MGGLGQWRGALKTEEEEGTERDFLRKTRKIEWVREWESFSGNHRTCAVADIPWTSSLFLRQGSVCSGFRFRLIWGQFSRILARRLVRQLDVIWAVKLDFYPHSSPPSWQGPMCCCFGLLFVDCRVSQHKSRFSLSSRRTPPFWWNASIRSIFVFFISGRICALVQCFVDT